MEKRQNIRTKSAFTPSQNLRLFLHKNRITRKKEKLGK